MTGDDVGDLQLTQLVSSRICHDLVGPVGAINTAIELMSDGGTGPLDGEALAVLERSVREASARLGFFRTAFGYGGGAETELAVADIEDLISGFVPANKVAFRCDVISETGGTLTNLPAYAGKLAMVLAMIGGEALPRGGDLSLHLASLDDGLGLGVRAEGPGAAIKDIVRATLGCDAASPEITARNAHGHFASRLAMMLAAQLEVSSGPDFVGIATLIKG